MKDSTREALTRALDSGFQFPDRLTMVRRLVNAECENLESCDSQLALPEVICGGFRGYGQMDEEELRAEYADTFNVADPYQDVLEPNEADAPKYDDPAMEYFENSECAWDDELKAMVRAANANDQR